MILMCHKILDGFSHDIRGLSRNYSVCDVKVLLRGVTVRSTLPLVHESQGDDSVISLMRSGQYFCV